MSPAAKSKGPGAAVRCAIYLRISQDRELDGLAIDRQRADCERIAADRGWTVHEIYTDQSRSATDKTRRRPAYDRMVAAYEAGEFTAIICWDLDRLTRQPRQLEDWIDRTEERGLVLVTASGEADLETDNGRLFARMKASVARSEVDRKSARQSRAQQQRAQQGRPPKGIRPMGYRLTGEIVEDEATAVRATYKAFLAEDGGTLTAIARALSGASTDADLKANPLLADVPAMPRFTAVLADEREKRRIEQGLPPRKPTVDSDGTTVRRRLPPDPTAPWPPSTILELLRNPRYAGFVAYTPTKVRKGEIAANTARRSAAAEAEARARDAANRAELAARRDGADDDTAAAAAKAASDAVIAAAMAAAAKSADDDSGEPAAAGRRRSWRDRVLKDEDGNPVKGQWEPLVTEETWHAAQAKLDDAGRARNTSGTDRKHLGSGLYLCGVCGLPMRSTTIGYKCREKGHVTRTGPAIDDYVLRTVRGRLARPDAAVAVPAGGSAKAAEASRQIDAVRARIKRAEKDYFDELIDALDLQRVRRTGKARIDELEAERLMASRAGAALTVPLLGVPDPAAAFDEADLESQRAVVDALVEVRVMPGKQGRKGFDPASVQIAWRTGD